MKANSGQETSPVLGRGRGPNAAKMYARQKGYMSVASCKTTVVERGNIFKAVKL